MKKIFISLIAVCFLAAGCVPIPQPDQEVKEQMDEIAKPTVDPMVKPTLPPVMPEFDYAGSLDDVTMAKAVRGINTAGNASGVAMAVFINGTYMLSVEFSNLPDPVGTDFYEGWIVRKNPFDVISTGKLEKKDGQFINMYQSGQDLTDHDFYVLTIEPDDGDPAPADHILEGTLELIK